MDTGSLSLASDLLRPPVPQRLALPHGAHEVLATGAEHRGAENHSTGRKKHLPANCTLHSMLLHAKIPGQTSNSRSQPRSPGVTGMPLDRPSSWTLGPVVPGGWLS